MKEKISPSLEDYLEAVYLMKAKGARVTDIAENLKVSKPSVHKAIRQLCEKGLALHKSYGSISLTEEGEKMASDVILKHRAILKFLQTVLKVPPETAEEEACKIEHVISGDTARRMAEYIHKIKE